MITVLVFVLKYYCRMEAIIESQAGVFTAWFTHDT